ncbi:hypothetical protein [Tunturiibacter gelidiferens]
MRGSLHCAVHDETVNSFGRDDDFGVREEEGKCEGLSTALLTMRL